MTHNIFFTADLHFGHRGLLRHVRPEGRFASTEERDLAIVDAWNAQVKSGDRVYVLGDVAITTDDEYLRLLLQELEGQITLVYGNHDKDTIKGRVENRFDTIAPYLEIKVPSEGRQPGEPRQKIVLFHFPIERWNGSHANSWHLHGHEHGALPLSPFRRMDVGIDANDYKLVSLEAVRAFMADRLPTLHHEDI